jgi:hypothetical protein
MADDKPKTQQTQPKGRDKHGEPGYLNEFA